MSAPGYFGKVVTHGDFVSRRLAPDFVAGWDGWLQAGMAHAQRALGPRWLAAYLNSPVWHFAIAPGLCGAGAVAGVMIPSVDRVGRYFPLTVAGPVADAGADLAPDLFVASAAWFDTLMRLALGSLAPAYCLAEMDAALAAVARPPQCATALAGRALFWTAGSVSMAPTLLVHDRLPLPGAFSAMLG